MMYGSVHYRSLILPLDNDFLVRQKHTCSRAAKNYCPVMPQQGGAMVWSATQVVG